MRLGNRKQRIFWIVALIALGGTGVFLANKPSSITDESDTLAENAFLEGISGGSVQATKDGEYIYIDTEHGFSFRYPADFSAGAFSDAEGTKTILVQDAEKNTGIQVYTSSFDEDIVLTQGRIRRELPDLVMNDIENMSVDKVQALSFQSTNVSVGESREAWFVYDGNLYQISSSIKVQEILDTIIKTWKWGG